MIKSRIFVEDYFSLLVHGPKREVYFAIIFPVPFKNIYFNQRMILYLTTHFGLLIHFWALLVFSNRGHLQGPHMQVATFFFSYIIIAKFILSLSPQTPFVWAVHETLLLEAKSRLTVFPKGKQQKNHLSLHSFPHQGLLLTE